MYRGADKSLARPGRKQARKHVRDERDFDNIETRAVIKSLFLQCKTPKEIHAIMTETLAWFLPGRAKNLSAPLYKSMLQLEVCSGNGVGGSVFGVLLYSFFILATSSHSGVEGYCCACSYSLTHATLGRTPLHEGSARRRDLYLTTHNTCNIHAAGGIRTHNPSNRAAADPRFRPRGHRNQQISVP